MRRCASNEIKSNVEGQWTQIVGGEGVSGCTEKLFLVRREFPRGDGRAVYCDGSPPPPQVPLFVVGYEGWKNIDTVRKKRLEGKLDGLLVLDDPGLYAGRTDAGRSDGEGANAIWNFIADLHARITPMVFNSFDPRAYAP